MDQIKSFFKNKSASFKHFFRAEVFLILTIAAVAAIGGTQKEKSSETKRPNMALAAEIDSPYGLSFDCSKPQLDELKISQYLGELGVERQWITVNTNAREIKIALRPELGTSSTLNISQKSDFKVKADLVELLDPYREPRQVPTVSKKEIALALLHPGRLTQFSGDDCGLQAFKDDLGVRQNIVGWAQTLKFGWPNGKSAVWNEKYWAKGTPIKGVDLHSALTDAVINPGDYSIGCYTAAKLVLVAATLDYYSRIKGEPNQTKQVRAALMSDGDPLRDIEPGVAWSLIPGHPKEDDSIHGKILDVKTKVAPLNFVPGDWLYLLNPDGRSYEKTGYEGSNAIYLGMNRFTDYYNENSHSYNFKQKVNEVYQWRYQWVARSLELNGDESKNEPLSKEGFAKLGLSPEDGGVLMAHRLIPRHLN